jgi:hypothetical protein
MSEATSGDRLSALARIERSSIREGFELSRAAETEQAKPRTFQRAQRLIPDFAPEGRNLMEFGT